MEEGNKCIHCGEEVKDRSICSRCEREDGKEKERGYVD